MTQSATVSPSPSTDQAVSTWEVDPAHTSASFRVRHLMVSHVRGELGPVSGTVVLDERDLTRSRVFASIDARGINTREEKRDEHLKSADFFDVENHPQVTFESTSLRRLDDGGFAVVGNLTIRGVSKSVTLNVEPLPPAIADPWGNVKRGATARTTLNRKDFGLTWNMALEAGGVVVGDQVSVEIEIELVRRK